MINRRAPNRNKPTRQVAAPPSSSYQNQANMLANNTQPAGRFAGLNSPQMVNNPNPITTTREGPALAAMREKQSRQRAFQQNPEFQEKIRQYWEQQQQQQPILGSGSQVPVNFRDILRGLNIGGFSR